MQPGSVIVDLAAAGGGNCELTVPGEKVVTDNGVHDHRLHRPDQPDAAHTASSTAPTSSTCSSCSPRARTASWSSTSTTSSQRGITVARDGESMWPPPPVQVSAPRRPRRAAAVPAAEPSRRSRADPRREALYAAGLAAVLFALVAAYSPPDFLGHFTVFALAVFVGYYVITNVATPCTPR